eukprot:scaffold5302_cov115-Skeletonema_marinoi.AAC.1
MAALPIEQPMRSSRRLDMAGRTRKGPTNSGATKGCLLFHTFYILAAIACAGASRPHTTAFVTRRAGGQNKKLQSDNYNTAATNCYGWCQKGMTTNISTKSMIGFGSSAAILPNPTRPNSWLLSATSADSEAVSSPVEDEDEWRTVLAAFQMYKAAYGDLKVPSRFVVPVYDALKTYREQVQPTGPLDVPANYVVPDCEPWPDSTRGLPLGKIIPAVRTKAYYKQHPEAEAKLNSLGFQPDVTTAANDLRYKRVFDALKKYKELYGDLLVPQPFTVPDSEDWPEEVRGLRLGARVNAIRSQGTFVKSNPARRDELDELGFVWEPPTNAEGKKRGRKRKDEMEAEGDDSASGAMASLFGTAASSFDTTRDPFFTGDQSTPPQWAFEGDDDDAAFMEEEKESTKVAVPKSFNETLEEMAEVAMSVGIMERWTPQKRVVKGARPKYVPWRNDDFGADFVFEDVVEALTLYKELYENFDSIEEDEFVVPEPVEESLRLSPFELAAMNGDSPDDLDDLDAPWSEDEDDLDDKFSVVASNDWPEHLAGMKLGQIVSRIREGGLEVKHLPERKAMLDDIDFDWGDPRRFIDVPFEKVMCALFGYFMIRGDTFVRPGFVMPEERPWPTILAGFELGAAVARLRQLQNFLETYHPVKMSLLRMVDFSFFPELAEPLDPNADEMNMEHLYVETFGHPLYHISTVPLGLPERMLADGPNGPPEKLSSWYNYEYVREFHERPGALTDVADWMRDIGFVQLAEEHEQKYGQSHYRQLFLLKEKLENGEIGQDIWDQEIERIQEEVML